MTEQTWNQQHEPWRWWGVWVLAHMLAGGIVLTMLRVVLRVPDWSIFGLAFALSQWPLLRPFIKVRIWHWLGMSTLAGLVAYIIRLIGDFYSSFWLSYIVDGFISGGFLAAVQWFMFRQPTISFRAWVLANMIGLSLGVPLSIVVNGIWSAMIGQVGDGAVAWAASGTIYGVVTGLTLMASWRLRGTKWATPAFITSRQRTIFLLGCITLSGLALRLYKLDWADYWHDELISLFAARTTLVDMIHALGASGTHPPSYYTLVHSNHPPLFYLMLRAWTLAFGEGLLTMRLPSVLLSTLCIPLTFWLGRTLVNTPVGLVAAALMAGSPFHIFHGQQARMYPLMAVLILLMLLLFLYAWRHNRWYQWLMLGICFAAGFYTQVYFFFFVPPLLLWAVYVSYHGIAAPSHTHTLPLNRHDIIWRWGGLILALGFGGVLFLPFLYSMMNITSGVIENFWIPNMQGGEWLFTLVSITNHATIAQDSRLGTPFWYLVLTITPGFLVAALTIGASIREAMRHPHERPTWVLLLLFLWVPIAIAMGISLVARPIFLDRGLIGTVAPFTILMAWCGMRFWHRRQTQVLTGALILSSLASIAFAAPQTLQPSPMRQMVLHVVRQQQPGDAIAVTDWQSLYHLALLAPQADDIFMVPYPDETAFWQARMEILGYNPQFVQPVASFAPDYRHVLFVLTGYTFHGPYQQATNHAWLKEHGRLIEQTSFGSAYVFHYEILPDQEMSNADG